MTPAGLTIFPVLFLLAGCEPRTAAPPPAPRPQPQAVPPAPAQTSVTSLAGEWRVAALDRQEIGGSVGIAVRADQREIWWEPRCAGYVRSYLIDGTRFSAGPPVGTRPRRPGEPTPPVCLIAPPPQLAGVFAALDSGTTVARTPNNGIEISGGGHSLLLFSQ